MVGCRVVCLICFRVDRWFYLDQSDQPLCYRHIFCMCARPWGDIYLSLSITQQTRKTRLSSIVHKLKAKKTTKRTVPTRKNQNFNKEEHQQREKETKTMRITGIPIVITLALSLVQANVTVDKLPRGVAPSSKLYSYFCHFFSLCSRTVD